MLFTAGFIAFQTKHLHYFQWLFIIGTCFVNEVQLERCFKEYNDGICHPLETVIELGKGECCSHPNVEAYSTQDYTDHNGNFPCRRCEIKNLLTTTLNPSPTTQNSTTLITSPLNNSTASSIVEEDVPAWKKILGAVIGGILGAVIGALIGFIILIIVFCWIKRERNTKETQNLCHKPTATTRERRLCEETEGKNMEIPSRSSPPSPECYYNEVEPIYENMPRNVQPERKKTLSYPTYIPEQNDDGRYIVMNPVDPVSFKKQDEFGYEIMQGSSTAICDNVYDEIREKND